VLCAEGVSLAELAERFGTPLYVYSRAVLLAAYDAYHGAFAAVPHRICTASVGATRYDDRAHWIDGWPAGCSKRANEGVPAGYQLWREAFELTTDSWLHC
jgi:hypothetical protein